MAFSGCVITDDDGETEASTSGNTMTTTMTTAPTGDDSGTMGMTTMPGTGDGTGTTEGPADTGTAADTGSGSTAADTGPGGDATEACLAACEFASSCDKKLPPRECPGSCDELVGFAEKDGCVDEFIAQQTCVANLDCTQYFDWLDEVGDPYPCQTEDEALFTCEDGGAGSSTGADSSSGG